LDTVSKLVKQQQNIKQQKMKKTLLLSAIASLFAITSFAQTASKANVEDIPYHESFSNPCTGENVVTTGTLHIVTNTNITKNKLSFFMNMNLKNLQGTSESGTTYTGNYIEHERYNIDFDGVAYEKTIQIRAVLTTAGGGNNLIITQDLHYVITADGTIKTDVSNSKIECQ
jgi:hypothetical protein